MRVVCWKAGSAASTGIRDTYRTTSGDRFVASGPAKRSAEVAAMRYPNTRALGHPIGRHSRSATRHEVMPRNATKRPQPSIEWGNDHPVSSRPNMVCQIASIMPASATTAKPAPARPIAPGIGKGTMGRRNVGPNQRRRSGVNARYASVIVAQRCIE